MKAVKIMKYRSRISMSIYIVELSKVILHLDITIMNKKELYKLDVSSVVGRNTMRSMS